MIKPPHEPPELFQAERPVRSDFARRRGISYKARRRLTLITLTVLLIGSLIWLRNVMFPSVPGEIPTIKAEGSYKEKPEQPGGIDIPHQDVQVYHEIDGSAAAENAKPEVEHMLPPPEEPKVMGAPASTASAEPPPASQVENLMPDVQAEMTVATPPPIETTVTPQKNEPPVVAPVAIAPAAPPPVAAPAVETPKPAPAETGNAVVQLAAVPDEQAANAMVQKLQAKYQSILGSARLHPVRADLGAKGIFYRIQSQPLSDAQAKAICAALKNQNAGCLLVRH